jgi:predicted RNase H-like HicB family nuclease
MLTAYIATALRRARYEVVDGDVVCATVPGLRGVIATAATVEECRASLTEVIEAWVLVRVARGLKVPSIDGATVQVKRAS